MNVIVRQPRSLPSFGYQEMAERARFETPEASETIGPDLTSSLQSQSLTVKLEAVEVDEKSFKDDRAR